MEHSLLPDHTFETVFLLMFVDLIRPWTQWQIQGVQPHSLNQICFQRLIGLKEAKSVSASVSHLFAPSFTRYTNITLKHTYDNHTLY